MPNKTPEPNKPYTNSGHGHVWERPDGVKARCGGTALGCQQCKVDQEALAIWSGLPPVSEPEQPVVAGDDARMRAQLKSVLESSGVDCSIAKDLISNGQYAIEGIMALIRKDREQQNKFLYDKYKKLWAGLVAVAPILEKSYPDDPRWSPWTRFVHPRMLMLQAAFRGEDIGELEGMARDQRLTNKSKPGGGTE